MNLRMLGILMLLLGATLLGAGVLAQDAAVLRADEGLAATYTDKTMWFLMGGTALAIGGVTCFGDRGPPPR